MKLMKLLEDLQLIRELQVKNKSGRQLCGESVESMEWTVWYGCVDRDGVRFHTYAVHDL